jgi:hypothetical protein
MSSLLPRLKKIILQFYHSEEFRDLKDKRFSYTLPNFLKKCLGYLNVGAQQFKNQAVYIFSQIPSRCWKARAYVTRLDAFCAVIAFSHLPLKKSNSVKLKSKSVMMEDQE